MTYRGAFFGFSILVFAAADGAAIIWCTSMSAMAPMPMPGGWTMSTAWMPMPDQSWCVAAASFLGMWIVMMVPMMLPAFVPMLQRYRQSVSWTGETRIDRLSAMVGLGYFCVWTLFGMAVFPLGVTLAKIEMQQPQLSRAVPIVSGLFVLISGWLQFTAWKARQLRCCRQESGSGRAFSADVLGAWRYGLQLGLRCCRCCANLMAILLVIGIMDLRVMSLVTAAITLERLLPAGERVARVIGGATVAAGLFLIALFSVANTL